MIFDLLMATAWPPLWGLVWSRFMRLAGAPQWWHLPGWWAASAGVEVAISLSAGLWLPAACAGGNLLVAAVFWWWRRKKRRSVTVLLGEKSRLLRAALVRRMRESARPRPVLRPVPGGAR